MTPSKFQQDIYDFIQNGKGSCVVEAVAGSGKTTTIVEAAKLIPESLSIAFVAFNRAIAQELTTRLPPLVKSCTLNSLGFGAWMKACNRGRVRVEGNKVSDICGDVISKYDLGMYGQACRKLVGLAKSHGLVPKQMAKGRTVLTHDTEDTWFDIADKYAVEPEGKGTMERLVELSRIVLRADIEEGKHVIDFDDQIYLPVIEGANFTKYDVLFVDEAQDLSMIQRAMVRLSLKPKGRLVAVGDSKQAIYGWRGAGIDSIQKIVEEFNATVLPLSISYRCPQAVVAEAQRYVTHIQSHPEAPVGKVHTLASYDETFFQDTDGIVCRNSAPLVDMAYKLIRRGRGCRILGREIGKGLINLIKRMEPDTVDDLDSCLGEYMARETEKLIAKGQEDKAGAIEDKVQTIRVLIEGLPEKRRTLEELYSVIESLFTDTSNGLLTLSTVHKAKGLEYHRVFILEPALMPSKWARQQWQQAQESNLTYVAVTRAKMELYYITLMGFKESPRPTEPAAEVPTSTPREVTA